MSYHSIWWLPLCGGLTGLGLVLSYLAMHRRGFAAGVRGAAWSLLPLAAYLTGSTKMFWTIGIAIGDYAKGFVFSPLVWSGIALAGLAVVLLVVSGGVRSRKQVKQVKEASGAGTVATARTGGALAAATRSASAQLPQERKAAAASGDDDMKDIEEILRRRGIS
jgi:hypothetical protein